MGIQVLADDHPLQQPLLDDTPIGMLRVVEWDGELFVAKMLPPDATRVERLIHTLQPNENPLNAIYGKRVLEDRAIGAMYAQIAEAKEKSAENEERAIGTDFRKGAWRIWNKEDGRDAFMSMLMNRKREA